MCSEQGRCDYPHLRNLEAVSATTLLSEASPRGALYRSLLSEGVKENGKGDLSKELQAAFCLLDEEENITIFRSPTDDVLNRLSELLIKHYGLKLSRSRLINYALTTPNLLKRGLYVVHTNGSNVLDIAIVNLQTGRVEAIETKYKAAIGPSNQTVLDENYRIPQVYFDKWRIPSEVYEEVSTIDYSQLSNIQSNTSFRTLKCVQQDLDLAAQLDELATEITLEHYIEKGSATHILAVDRQNRFHLIALESKSFNDYFDTYFKIIGLVNPRRLTNLPERQLKRIWDSLSVNGYGNEGDTEILVPLSQCVFRRKAGESAEDIEGRIKNSHETTISLKGSYHRVFIRDFAVFYSSTSASSHYPVIVFQDGVIFLQLPVMGLCIASPKITTHIEPR